MNISTQKHLLSLSVNGVPRWWRFYDNQGVSFDRYTSVMTGKNNDGFYRGMSFDPFHPQGFGVSGEGEKQPADLAGCKPGAWTPCKVGGWHPNRKGWGKRINFQQLPAACQLSVLQDEAVRRGVKNVKVQWRLGVARGPICTISEALQASIQEQAHWTFAEVD